MMSTPLWRVRVFKRNTFFSLKKPLFAALRILFLAFLSLCVSAFCISIFKIQIQFLYFQHIKPPYWISFKQCWIVSNNIGWQKFCDLVDHQRFLFIHRFYQFEFFEKFGDNSSKFKNSRCFKKRKKNKKKIQNGVKMSCARKCWHLRPRFWQHNISSPIKNFIW